MGIAWEEAETVVMDQNHWPMCCTTQADLRIKCHHLGDIRFQQIVHQNFTKLIRNGKYIDFISFSVLCFTIPLTNPLWPYLHAGNCFCSCSLMVSFYSSPYKVHYYSFARYNRDYDQTLVPRQYRYYLLVSFIPTTFISVTAIYV